MMNRDQLVSLIVDTAQDYILSDPKRASVTIDETTRLFGTQGLFDSVGLVSVLLDVEQQINDQWGVSITIADDRAMSQSRSPFRTISSLTDYVLTLIQEQQAEA